MNPASFLYSLRVGRWGIAGFSAAAFLLTWLQAAGFYQIAGHTAAERAAFGRSMTQLATQFTILFAAPIRPDTAGGYVQWRAYSFFAIVFGVWAMVSAYGAARGDEERGTVEAVLATGMSRTDTLITRFLGFAAGCIVAVVFAAFGVLAAAVSAHESIGVDALAGASVNVAGLAVACYALTLLICQLAPGRFALAGSGAVLLALFVLNGLSRQLHGLAGWRWLSPFRYYDLSQPLAPGGAFDVRAIEVLFGSAAVLLILAGLAFAYRDLGSPLVRIPTRPHAVSRDVDRNPAWRAPVARGIFERRYGLIAWTAGVSVVGILFVAVTKSIVEPLLGLAQLRPYFDTFVTGSVYPSFLSFIWFGVAQLLIAAYAISEVGRWSAEDVDGRLESVLSTPTSRRGVIVERAATLLVGSLVIAAVSGVAVGVASHAQGIDLDRGHLIAASLLLVPMAMFFAAAGAVIASVLPRAAIGLLGGFAFLSYFLTQFGALFRWPAWTQNLSVFHLYGQPLTKGVDSTGLVLMLLVASVGFIAAALLLQRRSIGA